MISLKNCTAPKQTCTHTNILYIFDLQYVNEYLTFK